MKKINKGEPPAALAAFVTQNPRATWDDFRHDAQGESFKNTRKQAANDQGGLCAYCEVHHNGGLVKFSIEHFHPKSDTSSPNINWALEWGNLFAVCSGGREGDKSIYPTPESLSCDAYKDHIGNNANILNPLTLTTESCFAFNKATGELE